MLRIIVCMAGNCSVPRFQRFSYALIASVDKNGSNIASPAWLEGHTIVFENARVIDRGNSRVRKTLESWHLLTFTTMERISVSYFPLHPLRMILHPFMYIDV